MLFTVYILDYAGVRNSRFGNGMCSCPCRSAAEISSSAHKLHLTTFAVIIGDGDHIALHFGKRFSVTYYSTRLDFSQEFVVTLHKIIYRISIPMGGNGDNTFLFYSFETKFKTPFVTPRNCRNHIFAHGLPIRSTPTILKHAIHLQYNRHILIQAEIRRQETIVLFQFFK